MSRKDMFELTYNISQKMIRDNKLPDNCRVKTDPKYNYLVKERNERISTERLLFQDKDLLEKYTKAINLHPKGSDKYLTNRQKISIEYSDRFIKNTFLKNQNIIIPLDQEFLNKNIVDLKFYLEINQNAYQKLSVFWNDRAFTDIAVCFSSLEREYEPFKHDHVPYHLLYPNSGTYTLIDGFYIHKK